MFTKTVAKKMKSKNKKDRLKSRIEPSTWDSLSCSIFTHLLTSSQHLKTSLPTQKHNAKLVIMYTQ